MRETEKVVDELIAGIVGGDWTSQTAAEAVWAHLSHGENGLDVSNDRLWWKICNIIGSTGDPGNEIRISQATVLRDALTVGAHSEPPPYTVLGTWGVDISGLNNESHRECISTIKSIAKEPRYDSNTRPGLVGDIWISGRLLEVLEDIAERPDEQPSLTSDEQVAIERLRIRLQQWLSVVRVGEDRART